MEAREIPDHQTAFAKTQDSGSMTDHAFHPTGQAVRIKAEVSIPWKVSPTISVGVVRSVQGNFPQHRNEGFCSSPNVRQYRTIIRVGDSGGSIITGGVDHGFKDVSSYPQRCFPYDPLQGFKIKGTVQSVLHEIRDLMFNRLRDF